MSDLSGNRISFSAEDNINHDKIIRLESKLTDLKAKYQRAIEAIKEIDAQNDDRCWYNVEQICHQFLAELGEKE